MDNFILLPSTTPVASDSSPNNPYEQFTNQVVVHDKFADQPEDDTIYLNRQACIPDGPDDVSSGTTIATLCDPCSTALIINDIRAKSNEDDETPKLKISSLDPKQWHDAYSHPNTYARGPHRMSDTSGWILSEAMCYEGVETRWHYRQFCIGGNDERIVTLPDLPELATSPPNNCPFCSKLKELFQDKYADRHWWNGPAKLRFCLQYEWVEKRITKSKLGKGSEQPPQVKTTGGLDCLSVILHHPDLDEEHTDVHKFDIEAWPGPLRNWLHISKSPLDPSGPISDMNIQFIQSCIDTCIRDHDACKKKLSNTTSVRPQLSDGKPNDEMAMLVEKKKLSDNQFVPTRLLDVDFSSERVRLVEGNQISFGDSKLKYVTLSYCWGDPANVLKTLAGNKQEYSTVGISTSTMPVVFQEAIKVVRELGIRYLWIDALCIIQNDTADWEAESVKMCDVFSHSYVTVSAARSSSSTESFLGKPSRPLLCVRFRSSIEPGISGVYSIRLDGKENVSQAADLSHLTFQKRAWVWQEQVMSTRQLIFADKGFQIRCNGGIRLEDGRTTTDPTMTLNKGSGNVDFWEAFLEKFTQRDIRYSSDKLAAVAGVAKYIHASLGEAGHTTEYLAGLWLDEKLEKFCSHILWKCHKPKQSFEAMSTRLLCGKDYCAPSWSWASRCEGVVFRGKPWPSFKVMWKDLKPYNDNTMVRVKHGSSIVLRGFMRQTPVTPTRNDFIPNAERWGNYWKMETANGTLYFWLDWEPAMENQEEAQRRKKLELFLISVTPTPEADGRRSAYGLLLLEFEDGHYRRVGMFQHHGDIDWLGRSPLCDVKIM
ncbi:hypothetical protein GQX73_g10902 [Xylaria multiplex]|uniref:Heterokaryon incompatibility domain-containing protein n=1 Tax=Xylaria multiplex TaxID=323545 RepID=A0A7C8MJ37_9PEZI|nr:hypothetical protein GQX73_g10902 [Xylaria multiplex]